MLNMNQVRVIDPILTTFARGYQQNDLIARVLFPEVPVAQSGGKIIEFDKSSFLIVDSERAPGSSTKRIEFGFAGKDYALQAHGLEAIVPDEHMRDAQQVPGVNLASEAVGLVMDANLLKLESQAAQLATNPANYAASNKLALSGSTMWSSSTSTPKLTVQTARAAIRAQTGRYPNLMILPPNAVDRLDTHPEIRDRVKYTGSGSITVQMLATYFGVDKVVEGNAVFAANVNANFGDVWGNNIILAYVAPAGVSRSARTPSFGYTYTLRGAPSVKTPYRDENRNSWIYGVNYERAAVIAGAGAGFLIQNAF